MREHSPVAWSDAFLNWIELLGWSVVSRLLVARLSLAQSLRILDMAPRHMLRGTRPATFPSDRAVRLAGACLGRSLARSQYLRLRGVSHTVVIGATGGIEDFRAHAWVAPFEAAPDGFVELRRIER